MMRRVFGLLVVLAACGLLACGGGSKRPPWYPEDSFEEDADALDTFDADAVYTDPGADDQDTGNRDLTDVRDAKDVKDVPKDVPDVTPPDLGPDAEDAGDEASDETPLDPGPDADDVPTDAPDATDPGTVDIDVLVVHCLIDSDCFGLVPLATCETVTCKSGTCVIANTPDYTRCDDDSLCTSDDRCQKGACVGKPVDCLDADPCTLDSCLPAEGCRHEALIGACDDSSECTRDDTCVDGHCIGVVIDCDDDDPCTSEGCDPASGCTHAPLSRGFCDDGLACTTGDHCQSGLCVGASTCDDGSPCTDDRCDAVLGCVRDPVTKACDDGDPCTRDDACSNGTCTGVPNPCDDGNPCTDDACAPGIGCTSAPHVGACDDGDACTLLDTCRDGRCTAEPMACLAPPDPQCKADGPYVVRYAAVGTCSAGTCIYTPTEHPCSMGCAAGACIGNPCEGIDCSVPPGPCWGPGTCVQGACSYPPADGTACDDANACTLGDYCAGGLCLAGPQKPCDDDNPCTADRCVPASGCAHEPLSGPCEDGDPCTVGDSCQAGTCLAGTPNPCEDGNPCTQDLCQAGVGCRNRMLPENTTCDDRNGCTGGDVCTLGVCAGTGLKCDDGNPCTDDRCDDPTVGCYAVPNAAACDDGNPCTVGDRCAGSSCGAGSPNPCDDDDPCTTDACDPAKGCTHGPRSGGVCDDGDPCTVGDECVSGTCGGQPACDDGNPCTDDTCSPAGTCSFAPREGACDDGNECSVGDACQAGRCLGSARVCDDGNSCTDDTCERGVGCTANPSDPRPCDDGDACTQGDACESGLCRGRPVACIDPPPNTCNVEEGVVSAWSSPGSCTAGQCAYPPIEYVCTHGCSGTTCIGDPCEGVNCSTTSNPCLVAPGQCAGGACIFAFANGRVCDDGNACTLADACLNGACVGGDTPNCDDGNPCTADSCSPATGCVHAPAAGRCDDGNACTVGDACSNGACAPGPAAACDDGNPCTQNACDALTGCHNATLDDGFPCSDGNACTSNDRCASGRCIGDGLDCDDGNPCTDDRCDDPQTGCYHQANTLPCDDGNPCTVDDACADNACAPGPARDCDDGNYCTDDSCDPATGCRHVNSTRQCGDASCSDLTFFPARTCQAGRCSALVRVNCDDSVACTVDSCSASGCANVPTSSLCPDDSDPCTSARCSPVAGCGNEFDTNPCDDGDACTSLDTCVQDGGCVGIPYSCDDRLDCTADSCDGFGGCLFQVVPGTCRVGAACVLAGDPSPDNPCLACDPALDPYGWSPRNNVACDDGMDCTTVDTCSGGTCNGRPLACNDDNACTTDRCIEGRGCLFSANTDPCNDGNPCTQGDVCGGGLCRGGTPATCDDGNPCTSTECLPSAGCTFAPVSGTCEDGSACTVDDACVAGQCAGGGARYCDDGNPCTTDGCDPAAGCTHAAADDGATCDDGNACTSGDQCTAGACHGQGPDCNDGNPCTDDRCDDLASGCYHVDNATPCDDGSVCTTGDHCEAGACVGSGAAGCDDGNPCTTDTCDPVDGCGHSANTIACDDGNPCTSDDACSLGRCVGGPALSCDDSNPCTGDRCDPVTGCAHSPVSDTCNDGNPCTSSDACVDGTCTGTAYTCNDGKDCTIDACDGFGGCATTLLPDTCLIDGTCRAKGDTNPSDACRVCLPASNATHWTDNAGGACNDGKPCTRDDICVAGVCAGTAYSCSDGLGCTGNVCDGAGGCTTTIADGWCVIEDACWSTGDPNPSNPCQKCATGNPTAWSNNDGVACSDGNPCTLLDTCLNGGCAGGPQKTCDDNNRCTDDACNPANGGCTFTNNTSVCVPAGCTGLLFQAELLCDAGICPVRTPVNCDDGNPCTTDTCTDTGCHHEPNTQACDDRNPCTHGDTCASGQCVGTAYVCDTTECMSRNSCDGTGGCTPSPRPDGSACTPDTNACTNDVCTSGLCAHPAKVDGASCDDHSACTRVDTCQGGTCSGGSPITCPAPDDCHADGTCDPATGACTPPAKADGAPCNDGDLCSRTDQCLDGRCVGANPVACEAVDGCHVAGVCYPLTGECTRPAKVDGATCDDGNPCTQGDACLSGSCTGGSAKACPPVDACHQAGTCDTATGLCSNPPVADGLACDDGNRCTRDDSCTNGTCGGQAVVCTPLDACHQAGTCDPASGTCSNPARGEGESCSDGSACTKDDVCLSGTCKGTFYNCNDYLQCTTDRCDGSGGCANTILDGWCVIGGLCRTAGTPAPGNGCRWCNPAAATTDWTDHDGAACDDREECTKNDTCAAGGCAGTPFTCDDDLACTDDACDGAGGCSHSLASGYCLIDGACHANGTANPGNSCQRCRSVTSTTTWTAQAEGDACDDGNPCTFRDGCTQGVCAGVGYSCGDGLDCTSDRCLGNGLCAYDVAAGTCFIRNRCFAEGAPDPLDSCSICDTARTNADFSPVPDSTECDDQNVCTDGDTCTGGRCRGVGNTCDDGLVCTRDSCESVGGACLNALEPGFCLVDGACWPDGKVDPTNTCRVCRTDLATDAWSDRSGSLCDDGDPCTLGDLCAGTACTSGGTRNCDDGLPCTNDSCEGGECRNLLQAGFCVADGGCQAAGSHPGTNTCMTCAPGTNPDGWTLEAGTPCDDGNACTHGDQCFGGACGGTWYDCNDQITCTQDICDGDGGCNHVMVPATCHISGVCLPAGTRNPDNECETCLPATSTQAWTPDDGAACNDGKPCTSNDTCSGGTCAGTALQCADTLPCTVDDCDAMGQCRHMLAAGWCIIDDACVAEGTPQPGLACHACVPGANTRDWSPTSGSACDDGDDCTLADSCYSGACLGAPYSCDDGLDCTQDQCTGGGGCVHLGVEGACWIGGTCHLPGAVNPSNPCQDCVPAESDTQWTPVSNRSCNDQLGCTKDDTCVAGTCTGTAFSCSDGLDCTSDQCDGAGGCSNPLLDNWCLIEGACYVNGQGHPTLSCKACSSSEDRYAWTVLTAGVTEVCNGVDDNCDGITDPIGTPGCVLRYFDQDSDGSGVMGDSRCLCAASSPYLALTAGDCDDTDPAVRPGGMEVCDDKDNDCDGVTDPENTHGCQTFLYDFDGDGFGPDVTGRCLCGPTGNYRGVNSGDCDDTDPTIYLHAPELCDGKDNDCDGTTDPDEAVGCTMYYADLDGDAFGFASACMCHPRGSFTLLAGGDCNDSNPEVFPGAVERCNRLDDNCDQQIDEGPIDVLCPWDSGLDTHGSVACETGSCVWTCVGRTEAPPAPGWNDLDHSTLNGCECQGDEFDHLGGSTCTLAVELGLLPDNGTRFEIQGNLATGSSEDWYTFTASDLLWDTEPDACDDFNIRVFLSGNPDSRFVIDMMRGGCLDTDRLCGATLTAEWGVNFGGTESGECPCSPALDNCSGAPPDVGRCMAEWGTMDRCGPCPGQAAPGKHLCTNDGKRFYVRVRQAPGHLPSCEPYRLDISNGAFTWGS